MFNIAYYWNFWLPFSKAPEKRCPLCNELLGKEPADLWVKTESSIEKLNICKVCAQALDEQKSLGHFNLKDDPLA